MLVYQCYIAIILLLDCTFPVEAFIVKRLVQTGVHPIRTPLGTFPYLGNLNKHSEHNHVNEYYRIYPGGISANAGHSQGEGNSPITTKVGFGYDLHRLVKSGQNGKILTIGGVNIPDSDFLVVGHSDGDVLLHSVSDAILGALGKGDIGDYFPDTKVEYKDYDSSKILAFALKLAGESGYHVRNIDTCLILERPKLGQIWKEKIKENLKALVGGQTCVNVKAKTNEKLDSLGENRAIACHSIALLERDA